MTIKLSQRSAAVAQSEIRAMSRECLRVGGINMAQGVCDLDVPDCVVGGAKEAIDDGYNIYTPCEGLPELRKAVAAKVNGLYSMDVDGESQVVISIGATGAFYSSCLALLNPGDEVILPEPFYGYHTATLTSMGCIPKFLRLTPPDWELKENELESVISNKTRAILLNTPSNPLGKVYSRQELEIVAHFAAKHDLIVFTDEIYEHFVYDGLKHIPPATITGLKERTVTISGFSKVFSITGWRLGYAISPPEIARTTAHFNDLVYVCAPSPLQIGATRGLLELGQDYYQSVQDEHQVKRDQFCEALNEAGLPHFKPQGAYYVLADISNVPGRDDKEKALYILKKTGVASVPGRAFFHDDSGRNLTRFCFAKKPEILAEACERIQKIKM